MPEYLKNPAVSYRSILSVLEQSGKHEDKPFIIEG